MIPNPAAGERVPGAKKLELCGAKSKSACQ